MRLADFDVPNTIQLREIGFGSSPSNIKKWWHGWAYVQSRARASHGERQLEQRRLELQRQRVPESEQVERWRSGSLSSQLLWFFRPRGSFAFQALLPAVEHFADFFNVAEQDRILLRRKEFIFPRNL